MEKRRNRTLSSWESNTSPEAKKPGGNVNVKEEDETHETDDESRKL